MVEVRFVGILSIVFLFMINPIACWDSDELEVFDVVEEVNQNFYTLMDVPQNANQGQIKKAFRRLSLVLHPDKNDAPDAEIKFRQLVAVYDILKDPNKRSCYDNVLENGLPDWKHAIYYYRRVRKMGLAEMSIILFIIISVGQYLVGWAQYLEHKFTVDEYLSSKTKKLMKKQKKGIKVDNVSTVLPPEWDLEHYKPSIMNTLPFQVPRLIWFLLVSAPPLTYRFVRDYWDERQKLKLLEAEEQEDSEEEENTISTRGPRRRKVGFVVPEIKNDTANNNRKENSKKKPVNSSSSTVNKPPIVAGGLWTDDDLVELVKLVKKYPVGTTERWEKIGETMRRPAAEVAHMAHKVKDRMVKTLNNRNVVADNSDESSDEYDGGIPPSDNQSYVIPEEPKKVKTRGGKLGATVGANDSVSDNANNSCNNWSQVQQKALEAALAKYPKGGTADRWEKIAKCVPEKTKEECMLRYKQLVELVKKKKESVDDSGTNNAIENKSTSTNSTESSNKNENGSLKNTSSSSSSIIIQEGIVS